MSPSKRFAIASLFLELLLLMTTKFAVVASDYTCETPESWLSTAQDGIENNSPINLVPVNGTEGNDTIAHAHSRVGRKWPGGVVKYKLHRSLTDIDKIEVKNAFEEYHRKTCIRFVPYSDGDISYTSIETDPDVCGLAHVCMGIGYQFAKFGGSCRNTETMIHELGHNLCLSHEQSRPDRDQFVDFRDCRVNENSKIQDNKRRNIDRGIYDYSSQMHYACNSCLGGWPNDGNVTKCGYQVTKGLSLLDADHINDIYDCQGCFRHRWRSLPFLTKGDRRNMYSFGYSHKKGYPLYPCRALIGGEIAVGSYNDWDRKCVVSWGGKEHGLVKGAQVLIIPGSLEQQITPGGNETHIYQLVNIREITMNELGRVGVAAGRLPDSNGLGNGDGVGYVAFVATDKEDGIGKVWKRNGEEFAMAHLARNGQEQVITDNFKVLVCRQK